MLQQYRGKACGHRQEQRRTKRTAQQDTGGKLGWSQHGRNKTRQKALSATKCAKELEIKQKNTAERSNICNNQWNEFQPPKQERKSLDRSRSDMWIFHVAMQLLFFLQEHFLLKCLIAGGGGRKKIPFRPNNGLCAGIDNETALIEHNFLTDETERCRLPLHLPQWPVWVGATHCFQSTGDNRNLSRWHFVITDSTVWKPHLVSWQPCLYSKQQQGAV